MSNPTTLNLLAFLPTRDPPRSQGPHHRLVGARDPAILTDRRNTLAAIRNTRSIRRASKNLLDLAHSVGPAVLGLDDRGSANHCVARGWVGGQCRHSFGQCRGVIGRNDEAGLERSNEVSLSR